MAKHRKGRPKKPHVPRSFKIRSEVDRRLRRLAKRRDITDTEAVELAIEKLPDYEKA